MFRIEYQIGKAEKKVVSCEIDHCTIGKAPDNLIVLRGWSVGKKHATIHKRGSEFFCGGPRCDEWHRGEWKIG